MSKSKEIEPAKIVDTLGELIAGLSAFAAKVPAQSFHAMPGMRPTEEAVESFEEAVYRFRDQAGSTFKGVSPLLIDSLEAFEAGKVFDAVPPLQQAVELLVEIHKDEKVTFTPSEQERIRDFFQRLHKLFPEANKAEVDLPPPTSY